MLPPRLPNLRAPLLPAAPPPPLPLLPSLPRSPPRGPGAGEPPRREPGTHRELVVGPQHVLLLSAGRAPADVAHHKERGGQADGRARQDAPPEGGVEDLPADHQGQLQEQRVRPVGGRA